jgi:hypothetical protein
MLDDEVNGVLHLSHSQVVKIVHHPRYSIENYDSDIALMKLASAAVLNKRVQLVCIPRRYDLSETNMRAGSAGVVSYFSTKHLFYLCLYLYFITSVTRHHIFSKTCAGASN